jgi:hypothetical protein
MKIVLIPQDTTIVTTVFILMFYAFSKFDRSFYFYVHCRVVTVSMVVASSTFVSISVAYNASISTDLAISYVMQNT